ncbi:MAG: hypothetical protein ACRDCS_11435 [Tannerellaceae bacterium]
MKRESFDAHQTILFSLSLNRSIGIKRFNHHEERIVRSPSDDLKLVKTESSGADLTIRSMHGIKINHTIIKNESNE